MAEKETELGKIVGTENVIVGEEVLEEYSKDMSFAPKVRPRCVAKINTADEIKAIVKWANDTQTPLIPISSGAPHSRGDTVPSVGGAVLLDLSGMKQIVRVDRRNRVALIEPGVTFAQLKQELDKHGLRMLAPLMAPPSASVLATYVDREPVPAAADFIYGNEQMHKTYVQLLHPIFLRDP